MSALQKSIRGSDPDAAVHDLARLVEADDIQSICRRLMVIACEDIGLAYPQAITIVRLVQTARSCWAFLRQEFLWQKPLYCWRPPPNPTRPIWQINNAIRDIETIDTGSIPRQLQNKHYDGEGNAEKGQNYLYPA